MKIPNLTTGFSNFLVMWAGSSLLYVPMMIFIGWGVELETNDKAGMCFVYALACLVCPFFISAHMREDLIKPSSDDSARR